MSDAVPAGRMVDFQSSLRLFFNNYVNFQGRSSRGAFWWAYVWLIIGAVVASVIDSVITGGLLYTVLSLGTLIPGLAISFRRLHDVGRSAWWLLIGLTGIGLLLLLFWYVQPGQRHDNPFGPDAEAGVA